MTRLARFLPPVGVGVALAADGLVASFPGMRGHDAWRRALTPAPDPGETPPGLAGALAELRDALPRGPRRARRRLRLHVALLPPLAEWRRIALPGLRIHEARQVLRREPSRYLPIAADHAPLTIEVDGTGWRERSPFTMVAAPRSLVEGIQAAAHASGWEVAEIVAAHAAWAAGAAAARSAAGGRERRVLVEWRDRIHLVTSRRGLATAVRRLPFALREGLGDAPEPVQAPEVLAARFVHHAAGPALLPELARSRAEARARHGAVARLAAAAALAVAAGMLELRGSARERAMLAAERARLREPVALALDTRAALASASARLAAVRAVSSSAPRWSAVIASLAEVLPADAYLVALSGGGDSLRLEGIAPRAALVFDAVARMPGVRTVRPDGPIRQVRDPSGATSERFTLAASLRGTR